MAFRLVSKEEKRKEDKRLKGPVAQYAGSTAVGALGTYGDLLSFLGLGSKSMTPGQEALTNAEFDASPYERLWTNDDDIAPRYGNLPTRKDVRSNLESLIAPSETELEKYAQRAGEKLGGGLALPTSLLTQLIGQGTSVAAQAAERAGIVSPEQSPLLELGLDLGAGAISSKVSAPKGKEAAVKLARKAGLSEREIVPLIQNEDIQKSLAKFGGRSEKSYKILQQGKEKLGDFYNNIKNRGSQFFLGNPERTQLASEFEQIVNDFKNTLQPSNDKKSVINFIEGAVDSIKDQSKPLNAGSLVNFWQDINTAVPWTAASSFKKQLSQLKEPIYNVLEKLDLKLASDFSLTNELYSKGIDVAKSLKPKSFTGFMNYLYAAAPVTAAKYLDPVYASGGALFYGLKTLARAAQTSPYTQGLAKKFVESVNNNKFETASKILNDLNKKISAEERKKEEEEFLKPKLVVRKSKPL